MHFIRFIDDSGRVQSGRDLGDGYAQVIEDPLRDVQQTGASLSELRIFKGKHALVADDDDNMREVICTVLGKIGCECIQCQDGAAAMDVLEQRQVDLMISDIMMPHFNGYELFAAARLNQREDIPIVLVTGFGYDPSHSLIRATAEGLDAVLYKPFTPQQLVEELTKALHAARNGEVGGEQATDRVHIARRLAPVRPTNIVCVGRNYPPAADDGQPLEVFIKPTTTIQHPGEPIRIPKFSDGAEPQVDVEGELAIVIATAASNVTPQQALKHVLGFTIANDVTARRFQTREGAPQWMRGKGFDTFCPVGPAVIEIDEVDDPNDLTITTTINGEKVQDGSTSQMRRPVEQIISELSEHMTLQPGTIILTGSPARIDADGPRRFLQPGDEVVVEIEGLGRLANPVEQS